MYSKQDALKKTIQYFNGDELATNVWIEKYCLKDNNENLLEKNPDDTKVRCSYAKKCGISWSDIDCYENIV